MSVSTADDRAPMVPVNNCVILRRCCNHAGNRTYSCELSISTEKYAVVGCRGHTHFSYVASGMSGANSHDPPTEDIA